MKGLKRFSVGRSPLPKSAARVRNGGGPKPPMEARRQLQKIIDDWDASGKPKTSAYWRLQATLEGKP